MALELLARRMLSQARDAVAKTHEGDDERHDSSKYQGEHGADVSHRLRQHLRC